MCILRIVAETWIYIGVCLFLYMHFMFCSTQSTVLVPTRKAGNVRKPGLCFCLTERISMNLEGWEYLRTFNMIIALVAILLNETKATRLKFKETFPLDAYIGFHALLFWCAGYVIATGYAWLHDIPAGPWTLVMSGPILATFLVGCLGRKPKVVENG